MLRVISAETQTLRTRWKCFKEKLSTRNEKCVGVDATQLRKESARGRPREPRCTRGQCQGQRREWGAVLRNSSHIAFRLYDRHETANLRKSEKHGVG
jgi:hypothetical protein